MDHCHETNVVRGLLCDCCNMAIGLLRDSPSIIERALAYVKEGLFKVMSLNWKISLLPLSPQTQSVLGSPEGQIIFTIVERFNGNEYSTLTDREKFETVLREATTNIKSAGFSAKEHEICLGINLAVVTLKNLGPK